MIIASSILIIDDEAGLRKTLATILHKAGYQVMTAGTAYEAKQLLQKGAFNLVFLDLKLPDEDGIQVLPVIRKMYPGMPVIILTAHATLGSAIEAIRSGARDYLLKPFDPAQIVDRVSAILTEQIQPTRQIEIINQIQSLIDELGDMDSQMTEEGDHLTSLNPADPARFLRAGVLSLDTYSKNAIIGEKCISLPPATFDYLVTLVRHAPIPVPYETLVSESQGYNVSRGEAREMARWHIYELRKALEENPRQPRYIVTVHDVGYRLVT
jgi:DNA-binding response OmpR family regulator